MFAMFDKLNSRMVEAMNEDNELGKRISRLRRASGLNQSELARKMSVSRSAVSLWENGGINELSGDNLVKMSRIFRVEPEFIQTGIVREGHQQPPEEPAVFAPKQQSNGGLREVWNSLFDQLPESKRIEAVGLVCQLISASR